MIGIFFSRHFEIDLPSLRSFISEGYVFFELRIKILKSCLLCISCHLDMPNIETVKLPTRTVKTGDKRWKTYYPCSHVEYGDVESTLY